MKKKKKQPEKRTSMAQIIHLSSVTDLFWPGLYLTKNEKHKVSYVFPDNELELFKVA